MREMNPLWLELRSNLEDAISASEDLDDVDADVLDDLNRLLKMVKGQVRSELWAREKATR